MKRYPRTRSEWKEFSVKGDASELLIGDWQVMQDWELPLMRFLAAQVAWNCGDILEIGFGMGIAAREIMRLTPRSYTVIEAHPAIAANARAWAEKYKTKTYILEGFWQDVVPRIKRRYDGILFDTFPFNHREKFSNHWPFIKAANRLLKQEGRFTYFSDEVIPFRQQHMTLLLQQFDQIALHRVSNLKPPKKCEYWKHDYMIVPVCYGTRRRVLRAGDGIAG